MPIDDDEPAEYVCGTCSYTSASEDDFVMVVDDLLCEDCRAWCNNCEEYCHNDNTHYVEGIGDYCEPSGLYSPAFISFTQIEFKCF